MIKKTFLIPTVIIIVVLLFFVFFGIKVEKNIENTECSYEKYYGIFLLKRLSPVLPNPSVQGLEKNSKIYGLKCLCEKDYSKFVITNFVNEQLSDETKKLDNLNKIEILERLKTWENRIDKDDEDLFIICNMIQPVGFTNK